MTGEYEQATLSASIVIATCNRPELLIQTLESILTQSPPPDEILIVDSSDPGNSREAVAKFEKRTEIPISYHYSEIRSSARQRNFGAERAKGEFIIFLDDDVTLEPAF